jgi:molybdopterin synthase catalytic subunit
MASDPSTTETSTFTPDIPSDPVVKATEDIYIELTPHDLDSRALTTFVRSPSAGATVLFIGTTRDSFNDLPVSYVTLALTFPFLFRHPPHTPLLLIFPLVL